MTDEQGNRPEGSIPGVRNDRFGWQPGDKVVYCDEEGNYLTEDEFVDLVVKGRKPGRAK